jgi:nucleoside-diphosphate-sugar epimerase
VAVRYDGVRVLVTGGSGFIGTNVVEHFAAAGARVVSLDAAPPRCRAHDALHEHVDVRDAVSVAGAFDRFRPTHLVHLAARTDLRGASTADYDANVRGVDVVVDAAARCGTLERAVFASSMLVCRVGYRPIRDDDYAPSTAYGESKVIGERRVRERSDALPPWCIVRPTSIWGPWFGEPYRDFFEAVLARRFVRFGEACATKTFGFVGNAVAQIDALLDAPAQRILGRTFNLGDAPALDAFGWADAIAAEAGVAPPRRVPEVAIRIAARVGDALCAARVPFPMTSFRLANLTTDNVVDLGPTLELAGPPAFSTREGIRLTLGWMGVPARDDRQAA